MQRIQRILCHPVFLLELEALELLERDRAFCRHDMQHLLDVARLMTIFALEDQIPVPRDLIYAAALLHDLGRVEQYRSGTPHEQAGTELAGIILPECGYSETEVGLVVDAIGSHRGGVFGESLAELLYRADKKSRPCYACPAAGECNWPMEKRNLTLEV